jgi:pyruvate dehydrogenase E2 component (dihydrolipoamide acetyltransferase)
MVKEVRLPGISENVTSGEVINILVGVGDTVSREQTIIEIETEKAAVGIPAPYDGKVNEILVTIGDTVKVGQPIIKLTTDGQSDSWPVINNPPTAEKKEQEAPVAVGKTISTQTPGVIKQPAFTEQHIPEQEPALSQVVERRSEGPAPAAPSVRRLARELGLDIHQVKGTGPGGRISAEDVKSYSRQTIFTREAKGAVPAAERAAFQAALPDFTQWGKVRREAMSNVRAITAENMSYAWRTIPHVTQFDQADITLLNEFKAKYDKQVEKAGGKLTVTAILLKIVSAALKVFPRVNASLDMEKKEIIYKDYVNIGLAVDTDRGLLVPVVKDVDKKNLIEIAVEVTTLAEKARNKRLSLDELKGGNFTISNLGGIGGTNFTPIVYWPEVAIIGVSRADWRPVYIDGQLEARYVLPLSLSYDHRVIDGADGARFLHWVADALENPYLLLMQGK